MVICMPQDEIVVVAGDTNGHVGNSNTMGYMTNLGIDVRTLMIQESWNMQMG